MREDMPKVIVERPRRGSRAPNDFKGQLKSAQRARANDDLLPSRASSARGRRGSRRELNEHLGPLRKFLDRRCGKCWNTVHGEIRERINPSSAVQMHILQHLEGYVATNVKASPDGGFTDLKGKPIWSRWLVNPRNGLLERNGYYWSAFHRRNPAAPRPKFIQRGAKTYHQHNTIWYEVTLQKIPARTPFDTPDLLLKRIPSHDEMIEEYGGLFITTAKRQLASNEIRRLRLRNQPLAIPESPQRR